MAIPLESIITFLVAVMAAGAALKGGEGEYQLVETKGKIRPFFLDHCTFEEALNLSVERRTNRDIWEMAVETFYIGSEGSFRP